MSVHEIKPVAADILAPDALDRLRHWAGARPRELALRHKRRGQWKAWQWADVAREVEHLAAALQQQGFGPGSRLVLSGAVEPTLILLALAAKAAGGHPLPVSRELSGEALRSLLAELRPRHIYVQGREGTLRHLAALGGAEDEILLLSSASVARHSGKVRVLPLSALYAGGPARPLRLAARRAHAAAPLWSEDGTEWREGLGTVLRHWLDGGQCVAFPESIESASRDRLEIAPSGLLLSPARRRALEEECESRLAPLGSLRRRAWEWSLEGAGGGLRGQIQARVRRLFGLQRLQGGVSPLLLRGQPAAGGSAPATERLEAAA